MTDEPRPKVTQADLDRTIAKATQAEVDRLLVNIGVAVRRRMAEIATLEAALIELRRDIAEIAETADEPTASELRKLLPKFPLTP